MPGLPSGASYNAPMETKVLLLARRELSNALPWPLRVLAVDRLSASGLVFLVEGNDRALRRRLVIDVDPTHSTLHLAPAGRELEEGASGGFLGSLAGAFLLRVEPTIEARVLRIPLETSNGQARVLVCEWTGRRGNLRLLDSDEIVIDSLERGGASAGEKYRGPAVDPRPAPEKLDALELAVKLADLPSERWPREIARVARGVSVTDAVLALADALSIDRAPETALPRALERIEAKRAEDAADSADASTACLLLFSRRAEIAWPGRKGMTAEKLGLPAAVVRVVPEPLFAPFAAPGADLFTLMARAHKANADRAEEETRRASILRVLTSDMKRLVRLRENLIAERGAPGEGVALRKFGEAILAQFAQIERGQAELIAPDYAGGEDAPPIRIPLDPARSVKDNAESYFRRARRWERGEPHRKKRLELIDQSVVKLSRVESRVKDSDGAPSESAVENWRRDALGLMWKPAFRAEAPADARAATESARGTKSARKEAPATSAATAQRHPKDRRESFRPRAFTTKEGWTVWVGRSNKENDHVTHVLAHPEDFWFHAHGVPGSHVVLRREGRKDNPSAKTLEEAAAIAAFFSKARHAGKAPVIYTLKKYVRKPRKAPAGLAMVEREKMIMIAPRNPDEGKAPEWSEE